MEDEQIELQKLTIHQQSKRSSGTLHMRVAKQVFQLLEWQ
jgi:hypothetical protein